jgi:hypothetical protein
MYRNMIVYSLIYNNNSNYRIIVCIVIIRDMETWANIFHGAERGAMVVCDGGFVVVCSWYHTTLVCMYTTRHTHSISSI